MFVVKEIQGLDFSELLMDIQFLFIDDSFNHETKYSSLTGILIPLSKFEKIRDEFYSKILNQFVIIGENEFNLNPPIIHGKELLKGTVYEGNDEKKLEIFQAVVSIFNDNSIQIYRLGWLKDKSVDVFKGLDKKLMGIVFPKFIELIDKDIRDSKVIPIMDGLDVSTSKILSQFIKNLEIMRRLPNNENLIFKNAQNIYGEVFYADSKFSMFIQLTDIISYLLHCRDYKSFEKTYNDFKGKIIELAENVNSDLINQKYCYTVNNSQ